MHFSNSSQQPKRITRSSSSELNDGFLDTGKALKSLPKSLQQKSLLQRSASSDSAADVNSGNSFRGKLTKKSTGSVLSSTRFLSIVLNIGLSVTIFFALVLVFDPTLDEHVQIKNQNGKNHPFITLTKAHDTNEGSYKSESVHIGGLSVDRRDRILDLLDQAGVTDLTISQVESLPKWENIKKLYGDEIIVKGKENCDKYQKSVEKQDRIIGVAGLFNTGTNYADIMIHHNLVGLDHPNIWQVPWGKHRMAYVKWNHTAPDMEKYNKTNVFPIVVIRDPFSWMQSMCKAPYAAHWRHKSHHCPNLAMSEVDEHQYPSSFKNSHFPVSVRFDENQKVEFDSLVHLWSEWYQHYLKVDYPILMIRYEDLIFQPSLVLNEIAKCVGAKVRKDVVFQVNSSKQHGSGTDYIKAIIKTADVKARSNNMTTEDFKYAAINVDAELMNMFQYKHPTEIS